MTSLPSVSVSEHPDPTWRYVPWDSETLRMPAFECRDPGPRALAAAFETHGHYSAKVDPLRSTELLHGYGFYYCDTLIEPYSSRDGFTPAMHSAASLIHEPTLDQILPICKGAFVHGRFHRDYRVAREYAELRYERWLRQMIETKDVLGLAWQGRCVGFFAVQSNVAVLHALSPDVRGLGIAKYLWTVAFEALFAKGHDAVSSSVSAANLAVVNLYASLGFRFRNAVDVYHRCTERLPIQSVDSGGHSTISTARMTNGGA